MVEIVSVIILIVALIILKIALGINIKKINELSKKSPLDELVKRLPKNEEIGKEMLTILGNEGVTIEKSQDEKSGTSLYLVAGNKIIIAEGNGSYAGVQTMAHECLHSVQSKKMLWFNFIYSNFYILYMLVVSILTIFKIIQNTTFQLYILTVLGLVFYIVRSFLEIDAMTKAKFLAKEYLEKKNLHNKDEIEQLVKKYDEINQIGIPTTCFTLAINVISKLCIYSIIAIIF